VISRKLLAVRGIGRRPALLAAFAVIALAIAHAAEKADVTDLSIQDITVTGHPITFSTKEPGKRDFGRLTLLGEAVLTSSSDYFGGYSGIVLDAKGEAFLAISDSGSWLSGKLDYKDGQIAGMSQTRIGPILEDGKPLRKGRRDAEALAALKSGALDGHYLISFEREHRIQEYAFEKGELRGPVGSRPVPDQLKGMRSNSGMEDLVILRGDPFAGAMVTFAEEKISPEGRHTGALVKDGKSQPLFITRHEQYDITDMQSLNDGSLAVLERSFDPATRRLGIRMRLIAAAEVKPGAVLGGEVLLDAGPELEIDNFEGLAVHQSAAGDTILTLISDDNFNFLQRTLLVQFKLK
jgi:hypothetical protein